MSLVITMPFIRGNEKQQQLNPGRMTKGPSGRKIWSIPSEKEPNLAQLLSGSGGHTERRGR